MVRPLKLELQAGGNPRHRGDPEWLHTDLRPGACIEWTVDAGKALPWPHDSFDEVAAFDALEHHSWRNTAVILAEWVRVLKPSGLITIQVPNAHYLCQKYLAGDLDAFHFSFWMFGGQDYPGDDWRLNTHYAAFDEPRLRELFACAGLEVVTIASDGGSNLIAVGRKR